MVNVETMKLMKTLDGLAERMDDGIAGFAEAKEGHTQDKIFYDEKTAETDDSGRTLYRVVMDSEVIDDPSYIHHDVVDYYDSFTDEYTIRVVFDGDEPPFIEVNFMFSDEQIAIDDTGWYFT